MNLQGHRRWAMPLLIAFALLHGVATAAPTVPVVQAFESPQAQDQDDMCLWIHPDDPALSLVIASDKDAGAVFVYDLEGGVLQTIASGKPGNIDVRYGIALGGACVDLVAYNERREELIRVYRVDPVTRTLQRVDDGAIDTGPNYGFTLHHPPNGSLYAITGPELSGLLTQYVLYENATGGISGMPTGWQHQQGTVEGMVGDDETGYVYLSEESVGIWKVDAFDDTDATMIATVNDGSGLESNIEGITIYYMAEGAGYILASSQGASKFVILDRMPPHAALGNFKLADVGQTDGIDVVNMGLGAAFPQGVFLAHDGHNPMAVEAAAWPDIVAAIPGLTLDTDSWDPRVCRGPSAVPERTAAPRARVILHPSSPNPVNPLTRIRYTLARASRVRLAVYDLRGRRVSTLVEGYRGPGDHEVAWRAVDAQGAALPSGIYLCRLDAEGTSASTKVVVAK